MDAAKKPIDLRNLYQPPRWGADIHVGLDYLRSELFDHHRTDMSPAYQRGSVWTQEQQELFMGHLLQGGEVLPIILQRRPDHRETEVLDGKQRLEACLAWLDGRIAAVIDGGERVMITDLAMGDKKPMGLARVTLRLRYINLSFEERKRFYVRLNSAGAPHTREQLEAALRAQEPA